MKIIERLKKGLTGIGTFLLTIPTKVFAAQDVEAMQDLYGPPPSANQSILTNIEKIAKICIIPIALLIGLIVYFKKSNSSKKTKILVTIGTICIAVILFLVINDII